MPSLSPSFANQLLIALPTLADPNFARTVGVICQHDDDGAMGVVVNRASDYTLGEVLRQMGIDSDDPALLEQRVLAGGPVHPERGFVLHDGEREWDSSLAIADGLQVTTSRDILEAIAAGDTLVATAALNATVECIARRDPAQYQWTYKRYTLRPPGSGEANPYLDLYR